MQKLSYSMPIVDQDNLPLFFGVYYVNKGFHEAEIETIKKITEQYEEKSSDVMSSNGDPYKSKAIRNSLVKRLYNLDEKLAWVMERLESMTLEANAALRWNFALDGFYENIQYAKYDSCEGGHFSQHYDLGAASASFRKISISVQLSDSSDYEGGDLDLHGFGVAPKEKGDVIIFPSFIAHQVTPVTRGTRESLVAWVAGPPFK